MSFADLTEDILSIICQFSEYREKLNIIAISKTICNELKDHRYFQLTAYCSQQYVYYPFFREMVLKTVANPSKQLGLTLYAATMNEQLMNIGPLHSLMLVNCRTIRNLSPFKNVTKLTMRFHAGLRMYTNCKITISMGRDVYYIYADRIINNSEFTHHEIHLL